MTIVHEPGSDRLLVDRSSKSPGGAVAASALPRRPGRRLRRDAASTSTAPPTTSPSTRSSPRTATSTSAARARCPPSGRTGRCRRHALHHEPARALHARSRPPRRSSSSGRPTATTAAPWPSATTACSTSPPATAPATPTPTSSGQDLTRLLAKVLRIDVDHPDPGRAYSVPKDNPFVGQKDVRPETWAYGFRNPWRMTRRPRRPATSGSATTARTCGSRPTSSSKGDNYGWSVNEGSHPFYLNRKLGPDADHAADARAPPLRVPLADRRHRLLRPEVPGAAGRLHLRRLLDRQDLGRPATTAPGCSGTRSSPTRRCRSPASAPTPRARS